MTQESTGFGRVEADGSVQVRENDTWRVVGSYPDASAEEALAYFERKFIDLESRVSLAEQRVKAGAPSKDVEKQLNGLTEELAEPAVVGDIVSLRTRVATALTSVPALKEAQNKETEAAVAEALVTREKIVSDMEALAATDPGKIRWKATTATITELFEAWQNHQQTGPRIPKKTADALWARFRQARSGLEKARRTYFQTLDEQSKEAKTAKRDLITQAEALAPKGAEGISAYRSLLEKWKVAPRASRSVEDSLWAKFKAAGDALYAQKAEQEQKDDEANAGNLETKLAVLAEFADILTLKDRDQASARHRLFHEKFTAVGPVPKKSLRQVEDQAKKFDQHVKKLNEEHWQKNDPEKQARSQSMTDQLHKAIADIERDLASADSPRKKALEDDLATKKAWLAILDK
jgi:hypothetical protein